MLWKLYDLIEEKGIDFIVPILASKPGIGGTSGTSFCLLSSLPLCSVYHSESDFKSQKVRSLLSGPSLFP